MLTRLKLKTTVDCYLRCLSDKPSDKHIEVILRKIMDSKGKDDQKIETKLDSKQENMNEQNNLKKEDALSMKPNMSKKVQDLLKSMTQKPKLSDSEYKERFTTAQVKVQKPKPKHQVKRIEEDLTKAAVEVAKVIGGDAKATEAELLSKVLGKIDKTSTNLIDLMGGMKVQKTYDDDDTQKRPTRGEKVKQIVAQRSQRSQEQQDRKARDPPKDLRARRRSEASVLDIYGGKPLNIFNKGGEVNYGTRLDVWDMLNDREVTLATTQVPRNYFEKMILWTEQGKIWKFPLNNEQGMEEEESIPFTEHIFLDVHLEGWCPDKGPIRHFMELVCVGLSKNAFYTAQEKKDHIMWYKEYFESKKDLLNEVGAWDIKPAEELSAN